MAERKATLLNELFETNDPPRAATADVWPVGRSCLRVYSSRAVAAVLEATSLTRMEYLYVLRMY